MPFAGGARGIGRACCLRLSAGGASIALNYRSDERRLARPDALSKRTGGTCELFRADVGDEPAFRPAADEARARLGPIQLLVANAGTTKAISHEELTLEIC
jgi:3-oxoacyl-[acyl-carrier protein] reductase